MPLHGEYHGYGIFNFEGAEENAARKAIRATWIS
jgi:hypothetical protein